MEERAIFLVSIRHCLTRILRFSGRDTRALFWPYAFTLFVLMSIFGYYWMMFRIGSLIQSIPNRPGGPLVLRGPGIVSVHYGPGRPMPAHVFQTIVVGLGIGMAAFVALMAAAVWRRLHDRGRTGLWGLLPAAFMFLYFCAFLRLQSDAADGRGVGGLFLLMFLLGLAYLGSALALVIMLAGAGTAGPNEFGPDPAATEGD